MTNFVFEKADKDLFAVYQTIYSQADIEMWYDWNARLGDTKWTDECYFLYGDGEKIGGAVIAPNGVMYPFLVAPFCDRRLFWKLVLAYVRGISSGAEIRLNGMPPDEADILLSFGAESRRSRQMMCRPTDDLTYSLNEGFYLQTPDDGHIPEMAEALRNSFLGGVTYRAFGEDSIEEITKSITSCFEWYRGTNTFNQTVVVKEKGTDRIVGGCIGGVHPEMVNQFAFIADVFVLPEYRGKGLAKAMVKHTITQAHRVTPAIKLHVLVGNPAEHLYRMLGFIAGPKFTDMKISVGD